MKIWAGEVFHQRKPIRLPAIAGGDDGEVERIAHVVALVRTSSDRADSLKQDWLACQKPMRM